MQKMYEELKEGNQKTAKEVRHVFDFSDYLDERLRNQEQYTSKDCVILQPPPPPLTPETKQNCAEKSWNFPKINLKLRI